MSPVIGVAGGTCAGKSAIVRRIVERVPACVIDIDAYYLDRSSLSPEERQGINYDEPVAIEESLLVEHVQCLAGGQAVAKPRYSFECHARIGTERVLPARVVIVDGLFALWWPELRKVLDLKVYVDAAPDLRLARRIQRDVAERGRSVDSVLRQYVATVRPMHQQYVEPTRAYADVVVSNEVSLEEGVSTVLAAMWRVIEKVRA